MMQLREDAPLVSIIIPAYNAATRIAETLRSVVAQDYPNIEIIVVNDCSTDETAEIARGVLEGSGRPFRSIEHTANRGVSAARNTGIEASSGEFLCFVDADDIAEDRYVSRLYACLAESGADIALCGYKDKYVARGDISDVPVKLPHGAEVTAERITYLKILKKIDTAIYAMMMTKVFLKSASLRFEEGCTAGEDVEFQIKAFSRAGRISIVNDCPYIYVHHENMGSVRDASDREKKLSRYSQLIGVDMRLADYLEKHSTSPKIRRLARCLLRPEGVIRMFSAAAKRGDIEGFKRMRADKGSMERMRPVKHMIFKRPELVIKALMLSFAPDLFYKLRSREE